MDASTLNVGLVGLGVLLTWAAVANQNPVDVIRSAFDRNHQVRPLVTGATRDRVEAIPVPSSGPNQSAVDVMRHGAPWESIDAYLKGRGLQVGAPTHGQTTGGRHVKGSLHYQGRARDYGRTSNYRGILHALVPIALDPNGPIEELFGPGISIDNGQRIPDIGGHGTHTHVGLKKGRTL